MLETHNKSVTQNTISLAVVRAKALGLIGRRDYSQSELQKKLLEKFPQEASFVQEVIEEFLKSSWISDMRYTQEFVREKSQYGKWGPIKISQKLREKGIEKGVIQSIIESDFSEEIQQEVAKQLAEEKWNRLYKKTAPERKAAVQRFLSSRGFSFSIVLEATQSLSQE